MKLLAITGLFASALLVTAALKKVQEKVDTIPLGEDERYDIDDLLTDSPE